MKFTFSWLKDYLETDISLDEVATSLTEIGLEVEEITNPKEDLKEFIIAKILSSKLILNDHIVHQFQLKVQ